MGRQQRVWWTMTMFSTMPIAYRFLLRQALMYGQEVSPRGQRTKELEAYCFCLESTAHNIVTSPNRKVSLSFMAAEALWLLMGSNQTALITPFNLQMANY